MLCLGYTNDQRHDLEAIRNEIGWEDGSAPGPELSNQLNLLDDEDGDNDWEDETDSIFHVFSASVARPSKYTQSWTDRLARERFSWEQDMTKLCQAFLTFGRTGSPQAEEPLAPMCSPSPLSVLCIDLSGELWTLFHVHA
jgi:hypothetical protein